MSENQPPKPRKTPKLSRQPQLWRLLQQPVRAVAIVSNGPTVQKKGSLRFEAKTDIPEPFKVYWQVVNTGREAERVRGLRGNFDHVERGGLTKTENTLYAGTHAIECFIVKDGVLAARSGPFFVTIQ
jgi:hypothetical protein